MSKRPYPRFNELHMPLPLTKHVFKGVSNTDFTNGRAYTIIGSGTHWDKSAGFGLWITYNDYDPIVRSLNQLDEDYACFMTIAQFTKQFVPNE